MLQWTGGSRRKMNNTRKSTYNRQRQYFEQKKRQKQTCCPNNCEDGKDKQINNSKGLRSLDILSLTNLTAAPKSCSDGYTGNNTPKVHSDSPRFPCSLPSDKTFPMYCIQLADGKGLSNHGDELQMQKKQQATDYRSHKVCDGLQKWKTKVPLVESSPSKCRTDTEQHARTLNNVNLLELLNDDKCNHNSSGNVSCEDHVAFSVEGLGKVGTETPVHSPTQTVRVTFGDSHTHPEIPRWTEITEKFKLAEDEFDTRKTPSEISGKLGIVKDHFSKLTSLSFGKDVSASDDEFRWKKRTQDDSSTYKFLVPDENFLLNRSCNETWKERSFNMENDDFTFIEDKIPEMDFVDFGDIYHHDKRNDVGTLQASEMLERHDGSFNYPRSVNDRDLTSFDWERYPTVNQHLDIQSESHPFSWSFQDSKEAVDNFYFQRDDPNFPSAEEGQTSSCFESMEYASKQIALKDKLWGRSENDHGTDGISVDKVKFVDLDSICKTSEMKWKSCGGQNKSWQGNCWAKTNTWSLFEGLDTDLVTSPAKSSRTCDALFDSNIFSKDDYTAHPCRDFCFRGSELDNQVNFGPSDAIYSEDICKKQKTGPINLMKLHTIYPFNVKEGSLFLSSSEECNSPKYPGMSIQKNVGNDNVAEESGLLSTTCPKFFQEARDKSSVVESASSSKTLIASDAANNCFKNKDLEEETPEGPEQSKSPKLESQPVDTQIVTEVSSEERPNDHNYTRNDNDDDVAHSLISESLNADEEIVESEAQGLVNGVGSAGHSSCKVLLESYMFFGFFSCKKYS